MSDQGGNSDKHGQGGLMSNVLAHTCQRFCIISNCATSNTDDVIQGTAGRQFRLFFKI